MKQITDFFIRHSDKTWFGIAVIVLACFVTIILPIYLGGIRIIPDLRSYVNFAQAFQEAFHHGSLFPEWTGDNLGFGSVGIRFYPPLAPLLTALVESVTEDWYLAFWISLFCWMTIGCVGICLLVAEWGSPRVAILAALFYTAAPFHLAEMYRFFLYAEFAATAFLPFCLLYLTRICRARGFANTVLFAVSFSLLILTHLPLTIIATLCFFIYALLVVDVRLWRIAAFQVLTAGILASLLTSFYWIRVVIELDWVSHAQSIYWLSLSDGNLILFPFSLNGLDLPGYLQNLYRHFDVMVVITSALLVPFLVLLAKERSSLTPPAGRVLIALSLTTVFCLLMLARPSEFLWLNLSFLQRLQFPWRWLSAASIFAGASFSVSFVFLVKGRYLRSRAAVMACLSSMLIVIAYDIRVISAAPGRFQQEGFNSVVSDFQSEPASEFWWPIWAKSGAFGNTTPVAAGERNVEISIWEPTRRKFIVHEGIPVELRIATFYYPYWHAAIDGVELTVAMDQNGVISLPVRGQRSEIILWFEEPVVYFFAKWTSAVAWLLIGGFQCLRLVEITRRRYRR